MINLNNVNMNEIITLEEAEMILREAKRLYPGIIDDVFVTESFTGYAYCRANNGERYIEIFPELNDELPEIGLRIIKHINKEFNSEFAENLKTITINAFCHEIGHAIDFEMHKMLGDDYYEEGADEEYQYFYEDASAYYAEYDDFEDYAWENDLELNDIALAEWKYDLDQQKAELDYNYRMITTEYAADKFSAYFMNTYMRHIPQLFKSETDMKYNWLYVMKQRHMNKSMKLASDIIK